MGMKQAIGTVLDDLIMTGLMMMMMMMMIMMMMMMMAAVAAALQCLCPCSRFPWKR
jgi:hypothetical protein